MALTAAGMQTKGRTEPPSLLVQVLTVRQAVGGPGIFGLGRGQARASGLSIERDGRAIFEWHESLARPCDPIGEHTNQHGEAE